MRSEKIAEISVLYSKFRSESGKINHWAIPGYVTALANGTAFTLGFIASSNGHPEYVQYLTQQAILPEMLAVSGSALGSLIGMGRQRHVARNVAVRIAEAEDREPYPPQIEEKRANIVTRHLKTLQLNIPKTRASERMLRRTRENWLDRRLSWCFHFFDSDPNSKNTIGRTALELTEYYWHDQADNSDEPYYRRRYAYKMLAEISKRLKSFR